MRMHPATHQDAMAPGLPCGHDDRLPAGGRPVIHGGIGNGAAIEARHLRLELEQHLQRALRDLRLVGRVGGQELAALDQVIDGRRHVVAIGPRPAVEGRVVCGKVLLRQPPHVLFDCHFGGVQRQAFDGSVEVMLGRHIGEQGIDGGGADSLQHRRAVIVGQGEVAH